MVSKNKYIRTKFKKTAYKTSFCIILLVLEKIRLSFVQYKTFYNLKKTLTNCCSFVVLYFKTGVTQSSLNIYLLIQYKL